jgi:hypothetical protein
MTTIDAQIRSADQVICGNIATLGHDRALLSQNLLSQARNLIEAVAVRLYNSNGGAEFTHAAIKPALAYVGSARKEISFLHRFHGFIQKSSSHYTMDGDTSERLMLKYYEYLLRVRSMLSDVCGIESLANLESFPVDLDPSLREYHEKIAERISAVELTPPVDGTARRYYIHKTRPFFVNGRIYYEITFYRAANKANKFDRIIAFTDIEVTDKYAAQLTLHADSIEVLGQTMPITLIRQWEVSIRPCEFDNFARLFGIASSARSGTSEYRYLMRSLTTRLSNLLDLTEMSDDEYARLRSAGTARVTRPQIFPALDAARDIVRRRVPGHSVIRYLLLSMHNQFLKPQYSGSRNSNGRLSGLRLNYGCIPFDTMPFCTSLVGHNPRYGDLVESLDAAGRNHELLARRVKSRVENDGVLYTPRAELEDLGDIDQLIETYNAALYPAHRARRSLVSDREHVFIRAYEDDTVAIVEKLREFASTGVDGYSDAVEQWLAGTPGGIDDSVKQDALKSLFSQSKVALVYGAAGTGKSTMVNHVANYFNEKRKLFLAHTNPAVDNLKRRVAAQGSTFRTISSHLHRGVIDPEYDVLVIDECSTVSNTDLIKVLESTRFKLLVLVGDIYQIESIQFGNWFSVIRSFIPRESVFELTTPFRTTNDALLSFWDKVRNVSNDIAEVIAHDGYSTPLNESLFAHRDDGIILCLNYDGLYGINNVNRFLQSGNAGSSVEWGASTYKVGDPVLFNDTERFGPAIYNNLKGEIVNIDRSSDSVRFDVELDRPITEFDVDGVDLIWVSGSTVRFTVHERYNSDEDDDSVNTNVPFQVAYAVSIHKAQGLEYDSVKIVITDANEENISHSIFYTAVTRARERLQIFWTPETQQRILGQLQIRNSSKDVALLRRRRGLMPAPRQR